MGGHQGDGKAFWDWLPERVTDAAEKTAGIIIFGMIILVFIGAGIGGGFGVLWLLCRAIAESGWYIIPAILLGIITVFVLVLLFDILDDMS